MVTGVMPFRAETVGKLKKCILRGVYFMPDFLSDNCKLLIRKILQLIPTERLTIEEIKNTKWLQGEDFPEEDVKYSNIPLDSDSCSKEEYEAKTSLEKLGVPFDDNDEAHMNVRNNITGTYRVVLHRIQKEKLEQDQKAVEKDLGKMMQDKFILPGQTKSKFCIIL